MKNVHLKGFVAWLAWMFVHLVTLLGMRNKAVVLVNWMWGYCSYSTSLRLIMRPSLYPLRHNRFELHK
jgi:NADH dehydrogenase